MKALLIIAASALTVYIAYRVYRAATLERGLDRHIANGAVILDVRTVKEFETGHIDGAVNISLGTLRERCRELDTAKTYITCCSHGLRSVKAESILKERGFRHVYNGGAWPDLEATVIQNRPGK